MAGSSPNLKVKADLKKNRLLFKISGKVTKKEVENLYTEVRFCVADLQPGFDVISDYSECEFGHLSCIPVYKKIMNYILANGVGKVVRVIDSKSLIFKQTLNLAAKLQGYKPYTVATAEEAEALLRRIPEEYSLQFQLVNSPVRYQATGGEGRGRISDISTRGCTVVSATLPVAAGKDVLLKFKLQCEGDSVRDFAVAGDVGEAGDDSFSLGFKDLTDVQRKQLWECLVAESQRVRPEY